MVEHLWITQTNIMYTDRKLQKRTLDAIIREGISAYQVMSTFGNSMISMTQSLFHMGCHVLVYSIVDPISLLRNMPSECFGVRLNHLSVIDSYVYR